jgi:carbamate kinase
MRLVVAIGGNALALKGERPTQKTQEERLEVAAHAVSEVAGSGDLVVTHGNGPQVGHLALVEERGRDGALPLGMDVLTAQTEGWIGYLLEDSIATVRPGPVATVLTRVEVDADDPAFDDPTKPIGPTYSRSEVAKVRQSHDWPMRKQEAGWRRVVASPEPRSVLGLEAIELLVRHGVTVIAGGGGGIPVAFVDGVRRGVDAVIDKDLTSALLAVGLGADHLVLFTDVEVVYERWGTSRQKPIRRASTAELADLRRNDGSMGPKVEAACRFVVATGRTAVIASLGDAAAALRGTAGTTVVPE